MAFVSSSLLWENLRTNNAFTIKRGKQIYSTDPYNLMNLHTQKFAGIAHNKGFGIERKDKKALVVHMKKIRKFGVKGKAGHEAAITLKGAVAGKGHKVIMKKVAEYRPDLTEAAFARCKALHGTESGKKAGQKAKYF
jgi:large subunit ribosomal protein L28e